MTPRARPVGRATDNAVDTDGVAFAIPQTTNVRQVKVTASADAFVGVGSSDTPPVASSDNTGYLTSGSEEAWVIDPAADRYVYVYSQSSTLTAYVTFYG